MAFNVDHLLNTNSIPSQSQRNDLQNIILQLDEAILNIDEDISGINEQTPGIQAKILVLQTRRTQLVQQRRSYSSLLSPVRYLPNEIFGQIFVYATRDRPRHVLNISAVCLLWRAAALSAPTLWSTLELGHHTTRSNMNNHINLWIERAHSYPLSLVIRKRGDVSVPVYSHVLRLALIAKHDQWKSITLDYDDISFKSILKELEFSNLEMLESFSLTTRSLSFSQPHPLPLYSDLFRLDSLLRRAPKLKILSLYTQYSRFFAERSWGQLTSLTIMFLGRNDKNTTKVILRVCVNLEEFIIGGNDYDESDPRANHSDDELGPITAVSSNNLRKLHTHCDHNLFLRSLESPSIQDFAVKASDSKYLHYGSVVYDYIKKNGSTLLKLSLSPVTSHSGFVGCIPYLQSLVELKLHDDTDESIETYYNILGYLVVNPEMDPSTIPLPRLEALEIISHASATEQNQRMFMKVIESRWWSDEEENARQKKGQRSLSRIKRPATALT